MNRLEEARKRINEIDREMARLYEMRMKAVADVARYKMENGLPVLDAAREREVIARNLALIENPDLVPYYVDFLSATMKSSREYQRDTLLASGQIDSRLEIKTERFSYPVHFLPGGLSKIGELFPLDRKVLILTDNGIPKEYVRTVSEACREAIIYTVIAGEGSKELPNFSSIERVLLTHGFTREDCIVCLGGGVVGDLGGFVASAYMRGIDFYNVPTTVLSMVDASVGGKTAINFEGKKNILGAFYPPRGVLIDRETLHTLPKREVVSGLVEALKMALTFDKELFEKIEASEPSDEALDEILYRSVKIKARVVEADEREGGQRRLLNFGHTIGHAIEARMKGALTHGEAVALGMLFFSSEEIASRLLRIYEKWGLPTTMPCPCEVVIPLALFDKKRTEDGIHVVLVEEVGVGRCVKMSSSEFSEYVKKKYKGEAL